MTCVVECRDFSFFYGSSCILDRISFRLERGQCLSILGANGSGKSTLLKNMLRLVEGRTSGLLRVAGRPLASYRQKELAGLMGYMPQADGRIPPFTVREFLNLSRYPFRLHGMVNRTGHSESVERALELTGIVALAERRLDELSGGQRQRAFLAAAIAQDVDTLLLDEPASFLDPAHAYAMNELLKMLHQKKGYTLITVTHDLNQPFAAGGMALVLDKGRQAYFGPAGDLAENGILDRAFGHEFCYLVHPVTGKTLVVA